MKKYFTAAPSKFSALFFNKQTSIRTKELIRLGTRKNAIVTPGPMIPLKGSKLFEYTNTNKTTHAQGELIPQEIYGVEQTTYDIRYIK